MNEQILFNNVGFEEDIENLHFEEISQQHKNEIELLKVKLSELKIQKENFLEVVQ